jgi:sugar diacid utilization regulator
VNKDINEKCADLANTLYSLSKTFEQISDLNKMIKVNRQSDLFSKLAKMMTGTGNHIANTGELIKLYCGSHMKYHL